MKSISCIALAVALPQLALGQSAPAATVYADSHYSGSSLDLQLGHYDEDFLKARGFNNRISSVQVSEGIVVELCRDSGFQHCVLYTSNTGFVTFVNDAVSSIAVLSEDEIDMPTGGPATVYRDGGFKGGSLNLPVGRYDEDYLRYWNFKSNISSLKVKQGFAVELCRSSGFQRCETYTQNTGFVTSVNDAVASIVVMSQDDGSDVADDPTDGCTNDIAVCFNVVESDTVTASDFKTIRKWGKVIVGKLKKQARKEKFALSFFSDVGTLDAPLSKASVVKKAFKKAVLDGDAGHNIGEGLVLCSNELDEAGSTMAKFVITVTDKDADVGPDAAAIAQGLIHDGVTLISVGIGSHPTSGFLESIASSASLALNVVDFASLSTIISDILASTSC